MKQFSNEFQESLSKEAKTLCHAWVIIRNDDVRIGLTDHDRFFTFDGVNFAPQAGAGAKNTGDEKGEIVSSLAIEGLEEADIIAGKFDGAKIELWMVDWQNVAARAHLRTGYLGNIARSGAEFKAEVFGLAHKLGVSNMRIYGRTCDAILGDARCGVDVAGAAYSYTGDVIEIGANFISVSGGSSFAASWFDGGVLQVLSGALIGKKFAIHTDVKLSGARKISVWETLNNVGSSFSFAIGDDVKLIAGCDKRFETCREKFNNTNKFRGFPHMPGNEFVMQSAGSSGVNDDGRIR